MGIVDRINNNLETLFDPENDQIYKSLICDKDGEIPSTITKPTDIDIGAIASEIEYFRLLSIDLIKQLYINQASGKFLKYQLEEYFASLRLEDETDVEWVQRTIANVFQQKVSRASIIFSLRPYSSQEPEITNVIQESAFADFSFADAYDSATFYSYTTIINNVTTWVPISVPQSSKWENVAYGNNVFISVSNDGTNRIMRSEDDGLTWTTISAPEQNTWRDVTYGNGVFIAVSSDGTNRVMRSEDNGLTWELASAPEANGWRKITFGNNVFISVSADGTNRIMRSDDDGLTWTAISAPEANVWLDVVFGENTFVAVSLSGTNQIMRSDDNGLTWSSVLAPEANSWTTVGFGDGVFIALSSSGTNRVMKSEDKGLNWELIPAAENNSWANIAYGNGTFVATATSGANRIMVSYDRGDTWDSVTSTFLYGWYGIAFGNNKFVAVSNTASSVNQVMTSTLTETIVSDTVITLPAVAETFQSSFFTIKITLYDTSIDDIWTVQNIIRKMLAAGISYILVITYT